MTTAQLVDQAAKEATVLLPAGNLVALHRLDGERPSDALTAAVQRAGPAQVADDLRGLGPDHLCAVVALVAANRPDRVTAALSAGLVHAFGRSVEVHG